MDDVDQDNKTYDNQNKTYDIDSIYGNRNTRFNLKVFELKYFLSKYDLKVEFQKESKFYSNTDYFEKGFYGEILHDDFYKLNFDELRFNYEEDDPNTEDIDERETVETRLDPKNQSPTQIKLFFKKRFLTKKEEVFF